MKKLLTIGMLATVLVACSNPQPPTPEKLSWDVQSLPSTTIFSVVAQGDFPPAKASQVVEKFGSFKTMDNIYDQAGNKVLIPRNAIVTGVYTNNGLNCKITWKSIYANEDEYSSNRGTLSLGSQAQPSICDPVKGLKSGDRLTISLGDNIIVK